MSYGIPYMGSKQGIVNLIQYILDRHYRQSYFIDTFTGGFAVSHYVLQHSNKKVLANDLNKYVIALIKKVLYEGLPPIIYEFVTRDKFDNVRDNPDNYDDWYVGYVTTIWSFGNSQTDYMYGKDIEEGKKLIHNAIVFNDFSEFIWDFRPSEKVMNINYKQDKEKRLLFMSEWREFIDNITDEDLIRAHNVLNVEQLALIENTTRLERLQNLQQLERLQNLQQLERLQNQDYYDFIQSIPQDILNDAVVYCDPPYENTATYAEGEGFDYTKFWDWFKTAPYAIYVSSYKAPDDIKPLNFEYKNQLLAGGVGKKITENLYWNGKGDYEPTFEDLLFNEE